MYKLYRKAMYKRKYTLQLSVMYATYGKNRCSNSSHTIPKERS